MQSQASERRRHVRARGNVNSFKSLLADDAEGDHRAQRAQHPAHKLQKGRPNPTPCPTARQAVSRRSLARTCSV